MPPAPFAQLEHPDSILITKTVYSVEVLVGSRKRFLREFARDDADLSPNADMLRHQTDPAQVSTRA